MPPAILGLLVQCVSYLIVGLLAVVLNWDAMALALTQGCLAAFITRALRMPFWWQPIQLLFAPALVGALSLRLPSGWYLAGFISLLMIYWSVFRTRVPLFLSSDKAHEALAGLLPDKAGFAMIDLGSGLGGVLAHLSRVRPDGSYLGVETAPLPFLASKFRLLGARNCQVAWSNFWRHDLGGFDVVYAYLSPAPMAELWQKARREMKPGSLFLSNTFMVPGVAPDRSIALDDLSGSVLHVWRM